MHIYEIVDEQTQVDFRVYWYKPDNPEGPYVALEPELSIPETDFDDYLQLFEHEGVYTIPVSLPAHQVSLVKDEEERRIAEVLNLSKPESRPRRYEETLCMPTDLMLPPLDHLRLSLQSHQRGLSAHFQLAPRHVAPEFR